MKEKVKVYFQNQKISFKEHPVAYVFVHFLLVTIISVMIRSIFIRNFENAGLCLLTLALFALPGLISTTMKVKIPVVFQVIIYSFIFAAEILGEIFNFYTRVPGWDTILHTLNGFLCAAIGFSLAHILNESNVRFKLSPFFVALVGFCFSMTVGVLWEFVEFFFDYFLHLDMQKDFIVQTIGTITLDSTNTQTPVIISDITNTIINTSSGEQYIVEGGYLDIGILDTMKDLLVNFIGAVTFCFLGFFYEKTKDKKNLASHFIVTSQEDAKVDETTKAIEK